MRAKIFSFVRVSESSVVASVRIARHVSEVLDVDVIDDAEIGQHADLDALIVVNGAFAFCRCLPELATAILGARRVIWIRNDYTIIPPTPVSGAESPFRKAFRTRRSEGKLDMDWWSTCDADERHTPLSTYLNWNCLTLDEADDATIRSRRALADRNLLYYGSFRSNRRAYFERYFMNPRVPTVISSPSKKFEQNFEHDSLIHEGKIDGGFYEYLGRHGLGLYIEDRYSHSHYCSPANRFYEMLSAGLPMVFQPECGSMMRRAGYDPEPYFCAKASDASKLMDRREEIGAEQRAEWLPKARAERAELNARLQAAWAKVGDEG